MSGQSCHTTDTSLGLQAGSCTALAARRLGRILMAVLLVSTAASCINDSFQNPLSDAGSSKPEPRLIGTWDCLAIDEVRHVAVTSDPEVAGRLLVSVPRGEFIAQSLTLNGHQFLFVLPREKTHPRRGWLVGYEHAEKGLPKVRLIDRKTSSQAIESNEVEGSFSNRYVGWFPWRTKLADPVLSLDSARTRRWLGADPEKVLGPSTSLFTQLDRILGEPMNAESDPEGDLAAKPEPCDQALIGETYDGPSVGRFAVEATDQPAVLAWSMMDEPDFGKPQKLMVTEIDGVSYLTAMDGSVDTTDKNGAAEYLIFRIEVLNHDTLALIPPDNGYLDAVVREKVLSANAKVREPRQQQHDPDWLVTSSTEQLRAFVAERGADFFPGRLRAKTVLYFRRSDDEPK